MKFINDVFSKYEDPKIYISLTKDSATVRIQTEQSKYPEGVYQLTGPDLSLVVDALVKDMKEFGQL